MYFDCFFSVFSFCVFFVRYLVRNNGKERKSKWFSWKFRYERQYIARERFRWFIRSVDDEKLLFVLIRLEKREWNEGVTIIVSLPTVLRTSMRWKCSLCTWRKYVPFRQPVASFWYWGSMEVDIEIERKFLIPFNYHTYQCGFIRDKYTWAISKMCNILVQQFFTCNACIVTCVLPDGAKCCLVLKLTNFSYTFPQRKW